MEFQEGWGGLGKKPFLGGCIPQILCMFANQQEVVWQAIPFKYYKFLLSPQGSSYISSMFTGLKKTCPLIQNKYFSSRASNFHSSSLAPQARPQASHQLNTVLIGRLFIVHSSPMYSNFFLQHYYIYACSAQTIFLRASTWVPPPKWKKNALPGFTNSTLGLSFRNEEETPNCFLFYLFLILHTQKWSFL